MPKKSDDNEPLEKDKPEVNQSDKTKSQSKLSDIKMPDISGIANKIDLDKILGSIRSMINPEDGIESSIKVDPSDALGVKLAELSALLQEISKAHARLSKDFSKANDLLSDLFKALEAVRVSKHQADL